MKDNKFSSIRSQIWINRLLNVLSLSPLPTHQIHDKIFASKQATRNYLIHLNSIGKIYIKEWIRKETNGRTIAVWAIGNKLDKERPDKLTKTEINSRFHHKQYSDPDFIDQRNMRRRADYMKIKRDPLVKIFFGENNNV